MLRVLKRERETKERPVSVGVSYFERYKRKENKESCSTYALNSSLQRGNKNKKVYFVTRNNTLCGDVQNIQIQVTSESF